MTQQIEHTFEFPEPRPREVVILELQMKHLERILEQAAKAGENGGGLGAIQMAENRYRREACLVELDGVRVTARGVSASQLLEDMSAKELGFMDEAIRFIHDVTGTESKAFLATRKTGDPGTTE